MIHPQVQKKKEEIYQYLQSLGLKTSEIKDTDTILMAFIHKSFASDYQEKFTYNERLEFLGDTIL
ncbi:MAG: hypothetical protein GXP45_03970 [bacterium]|nr:hypothetical protein [bacterium]